MQNRSFKKYANIRNFILAFKATEYFTIIDQLHPTLLKIWAYNVKLLNLTVSK